jgi:hypothetical protein
MDFASTRGGILDESHAVVAFISGGVVSRSTSARQQPTRQATKGRDVIRTEQWAMVLSGGTRQSAREYQANNYGKPGPVTNRDRVHADQSSNNGARRKIAKGRRWIASLLGVLALTSVTVVSTASPGQAASSMCLNNTGPTYGAWSTSKSYVFRRGEFCIQEPEREYRLVFQDDGNFVVYNNRLANDPNKVVWSTKTNGKGMTLEFQKDGNLVIYDTARSARWSSDTYGWPAGTTFHLVLVLGQPVYTALLPSGTSYTKYL